MKNIIIYVMIFLGFMLTGCIPHNHTNLERIPIGTYSYDTGGEYIKVMKNNKISFHLKTNEGIFIDRTCSYILYQNDNTNTIELIPAEIRSIEFIKGIGQYNYEWKNNTIIAIHRSTKNRKEFIFSEDANK